MFCVQFEEPPLLHWLLNPRRSRTPRTQLTRARAPAMFLGVCGYQGRFPRKPALRNTGKCEQTVGGTQS